MGTEFESRWANAGCEPYFFVISKLTVEGKASRHINEFSSMTCAKHCHCLLWWDRQHFFKK